MRPPAGTSAFRQAALSLFRQPDNSKKDLQNLRGRIFRFVEMQRSPQKIPLLDGDYFVKRAFLTGKLLNFVSSIIFLVAVLLSSIKCRSIPA